MNVLKIGGLQRLSLIDFPGVISCVIFTQGCPFRCHYCHNAPLVDPTKFIAPIAFEEVLQFLDSRIGKLQGVVISGGEPTIHKSLPECIALIKHKGFLVKLDTNGSNPEMLSYLIQQGLLDFVAMDIKAPLHLYEKVVGVKTDAKKIKESIALLLKESVPYEFRSTLTKELHSVDDVMAMGRVIKGAKRYVLQRYRKDDVLNAQLAGGSSYNEEDFALLRPQLERLVQSVEFR